MIKTIPIVLLFALSLGGCAPLIVGTAAGVMVYRHECYRWVETANGLQRVWVCRSKPGRTYR